MSNYTASPGTRGTQWFVWDAEVPDAPPIYFGTMEECGGVVDFLKLQEVEVEWGPAATPEPQAEPCPDCQALGEWCGIHGSGEEPTEPQAEPEPKLHRDCPRCGKLQHGNLMAGPGSEAYWHEDGSSDNCEPQEQATQECDARQAFETAAECSVCGGAGLGDQSIPGLSQPRSCDHCRGTGEEPTDG